MLVEARQKQKEAHCENNRIFENNNNSCTSTSNLQQLERQYFPSTKTTNFVWKEDKQ